MLHVGDTVARHFIRPLSRAGGNVMEEGLQKFLPRNWLSPTVRMGRTRSLIMGGALLCSLDQNTA